MLIMKYKIIKTKNIIIVKKTENVENKQNC